MDDTAKYLIHAAITADGVVERSDVVGAIFGQTEGLLGEELDLRDLQQSSKVGRIDVEIHSEHGQSHGTITIATSLDKVETAILAASLETITRVGPCQSTVEVTNIEDVREAKRRDVVDRAKELLTDSFDESVMTSTDILEEVRESVRVEDITEYEGYPAGPRVVDSDAIIVVEGRADVLNLLRYGVKNAVAVEGTNVPSAVADVTQERTVTAFLDGDRGGELILKELAQVGDVDYVAFAPDGESVEDLSRQSIMAALRNKVPFDQLPASGDVRTAAEADADGGTAGETAGNPRRESQGTTELPAAPAPEAEAETETETESADDASAEPRGSDESEGSGATTVPDADGADAGAAKVTTNGDVDTGTETDATSSLRSHVADVIDGGRGVVRLLDAELDPLAEAPADEAFDAVLDASQSPYAVVVDGEATQRIVDVAAQRGVNHVVARSAGEFVKKPVGVRVRTATQFAEA